MKRLLLIASVTFATNLMAGNGVNWFSAIENNTEFGASSVTSVLAYADSSILIAGKFATCTEQPEGADFLGEKLIGAPFTPTMSQTNNNLVIAKVKRTGEVVWMIHSDRGNGEAVAVPTADGGALVFASMTHTQKNALGDNYVLRMKHQDEELCSAKRDYDGVNTIQYGFVLRVTKDGKASVSAEISNTSDNKNAFGAINWASDGTNYYLLLNDTAAMKVNETTITPENGGSMVVLTFDQDGNYQGERHSSGQAVNSRSGQLVCTKNALYAATVVNADDLQHIGIYSWSLTSDAAACGYVRGALDNDKNIIQVKALYVDEDEQAAYIAGGLNGGLKIGEDTLHQISGKLVPFIAKYDLEKTEAVAGYFHESTGIGGASTIFERKDTLYVYEYDWGAQSGNRIRLEALNTALEPLKEIGLLNTQAMEVTKDAILAGDDVVFNINTGKGATLSFVADPNITLTTPAISGFVASVKVFVSEEPQGITATEARPSGVRKVLRDGQVLIIRDNKEYTILGQEK